MITLARTRSRVVTLLVLLCLALAAGGCSRPAARSGPARVWVAGCTERGFDPDGPPDAVRWALERLLSHGLVERDSTGTVRPAAAGGVATSADGLTVTFRLRENLRFTDGSPATSANFRAALEAGLRREDHATRNWLLMAVAGVERVRAGRPLPPLGIETPDPRTLVLRLVRRDSLLLEKLALPGVSAPWKRRTAGSWSGAIGLGPWRVARAEDGRVLALTRPDTLPGRGPVVDTLRVRWLVGAARVRTALRQGGVDAVWPLPPGMLSQPPDPAYRVVAHAAIPVRRLLLVFRADVPPTTALAARHALAHSLNREELLAALGARANASENWLEGAGAFEYPRLDIAETRGWLTRGKLGASFHVALGYDADLAGEEVARALQGQWSRLGLYAELRPLRGAQALAGPLRPAAAQVLLLESQALLPGAASELAGLVMPLRGPAVGAFRTGWRTREFDPWIASTARARPLDAAAAQARLGEERLAIPLAELPWLWIEKRGLEVRFDPRFGPAFEPVPRRATAAAR